MKKIEINYRRGVDYSEDVFGVDVEYFELVIHDPDGECVQVRLNDFEVIRLLAQLHGAIDEAVLGEGVAS